MRERLLATIRHKGLMRAGERVGVAVSGGADSVALLRLMLEAREELGIVLSVAHFNHKLRGDASEGDAAFVRELANEYGLEFFCESGDTRAYAAEHGCGIEAAAREMRYGFFWKLLSPQGTQGNAGEDNSPQRAQRNATVHDRIATAHTLEDQAETVVMRLARGAGTRGMSGIHPVLGAEKHSRLSIDDCRLPAIVRPLLEFRRAQLRHYLRRASQSWREDASNQDLAFARNRVRQEVMPKLRELNPAVELILGETAEIARAEEEYWREVVEQTLGEVISEKQSRLSIDDCRFQALSAEGSRSQRETKGPSTAARNSSAPSLGMTNPQGDSPSLVTNRAIAIDIPKLLQLPLALRRRVVREFVERQGVKLEFHHVEQVLEVAAGPASRSVRRVELIEGWDALVVEDRLRLEKRNERKVREGYDLELPVPGEVLVEEAGIVLRARVTDSGPRLKVGELWVRNWRPGDRYWPAHTRSEKKLKELLQDRRVPAEERAFWPVVMSGDEIVWVPGFEYPDELQLKSGQGVALSVEKLNHF